MEFKSLLEIKSVDPGTGEFTGYLAVFGDVDSDQDVIQKGAFKVSLASKRLIPILWQHVITEPIGVWTELSEDDHGLLATGKLAIDTAEGNRAYSLLKMLMKSAKVFDASGVFALSIGYKAIQQQRIKGIRYLSEIKLFEGSFVTFSANSQSNVIDVKAPKTKKVDGEDLHSSAFAYVGDPSKPDTWKLPIHFATPEQSAAHIRDALARFDQTDDIPEAEKPKVMTRIRAAADSHGIKAALRVAETKQMQSFKDALAAHELRKDLSNQRWTVEDAKDDSMDSIMSDAALDKVAKKAAARKTLHDAADAHADIMDQKIDAMPEADPDELDGGKGLAETLEVKAARKTMDAAIAAHVEGERKCMKALDLMHQGSALHTKGIVLARQLSYAGISAADDKTAAAAAGAKADKELEAVLASLRNARTKLAA